MTIREKLYQIRKPAPKATICYKIIIAIAVFLWGAVMGWLAKEFDQVPIIGEIGTRLGIWIFSATMIAVLSRCLSSAALHTFLFFTAMLTTYYLHSTFIEGFFPKSYAIVWGCFALLSPLCGWLVWFSKGSGWVASFCASMPIALLLTEGYPFFYTFNVALGFDVMLATLLFVLLPKLLKQKIYTLAMVGILFVLFTRIDVLSRLLGGL